MKKPESLGLQHRAGSNTTHISQECHRARDLGVGTGRPAVSARRPEAVCSTSSGSPARCQEAQDTERPEERALVTGPAEPSLQDTSISSRLRGRGPHIMKGRVGTPRSPVQAVVLYSP